jgi:hypothetical protein
MTHTNVNFSAVDFVGNLRKVLGYPISTILEEKVKEMFGDAEFSDFKDKLRTDMENRIWDSILASMDVDGISNESTNWYLHEVITNNMNIWYSVDVNHDNIISEILHDASGYLAFNLNDSQFEDWHGWFDEHISVWRWVDVCTSKFDNKPITEHLDIIKKYCDETDNDIQMFFGKESVTKIDVVAEDNHPTFPSKQVLDFNMGVEVTDMVFAILNTKTYDGDMGVTIVKGISPMILEEYGFDTEECTEIGKINVGDSWTNSMYGNGVVVVRMA